MAYFALIIKKDEYEYDSKIQDAFSYNEYIINDDYTLILAKEYQTDSGGAKAEIFSCNWIKHHLKKQHKNLTSGFAEATTNRNFQMF